MSSTRAHSTRPMTGHHGGGSSGGGGGAIGSSRLNVAAGLKLTEEEVDALMDNFATQDEAKIKTWTRRFVENVLSKYRWYFPMKDIKNGPSLSKAYAYYEHITLPRHLVGTSDHVLRRAEPGETSETELYSPFWTPSSSFIEWGIGVDLYFSSVRMMAVVLFLAGLISLPNILYFASTRYDANFPKANISFTEQASAICTTAVWVVCTDCPRDEFEHLARDGHYGVTNDNTILVQANACDTDLLGPGMDNWTVLLFVGVVMTLISMYLKAREVRFDEDKLTSTDYSVLVKNPPPDAYNPDEWRAFFEQYADKQVTIVTVVLNNNLLLRKLVYRRVHRTNLRRMLPKGTDMDDEDLVRSAVAKLIQEREVEPQGCIMKFAECCVLPIFRIFNMFLKPEVLVNKVFGMAEEIKELQKQKYEVSKVFVTFETEEGQRAALSALATSKVSILMNDQANVPPGSVFKDRVLKVVEPTEPSAVRYLDISTTMFRRLFMRGVNLAATLLVVAVSGVLAALTRKRFGPGFSGPLISVFNSIIPQIVKLLMLFEPHTTEGSFQASLYTKVTLFRWINTAILTKLITPFARTISNDRNDIIPSINAILWSELCLVPALRLADLWGNCQKHLFAPRARNQEIMNLSFSGTFYNLGERYTDLTKVLFLCFFYSALYPPVFFFGAAILIVQYYTDKFCLMRIWAWSPFIGSELAEFSRRYFFSGSIVAMAIVSAYAWAQFPYDNLCNIENYRGPDFSDSVFNDVNITQWNPETDQWETSFETVTVQASAPRQFCKQSWRYIDGLAFPPIAGIMQKDGRDYMSDEQETLSNVYGWTALVVLVGYILFYFGDAIKKYVISWFRGTYKPRGESQVIDFSCNPDIFGYVPQVKLKSFAFPFLCCNVDNIDQGLIGWTDPAHSYDYHNVIFDVPWEGMPRTKKTTQSARASSPSDARPSSPERNAPEESVETDLPHNPIFSIVRHYPPQWVKDMREAAK